ncbi:MAG TPA: type I secretion system permease/ATPase [Stellaceae bacterium]|jgi:ATP-binding cassette subfamily C protein LapB|nr:type I secretion system permease/ATPase [Stellaceae bacterium]
MNELEVIDAPREAAASEAIDDPVLVALSILASLLERPMSARAFAAGLPLDGDTLSPELVIRAAARAGLSARWHKLSLEEIAPLNLPCLLLLNENSACVATAIGNGEIEMLLPQPGAAPIRLPLDEFRSYYAGYALYAKAEYRFDRRTEDVVDTPAPKRSWFWGTLASFWHVYTHAIIASVVVNLVALASPLFVMNVYDRVVPNNATATLWVLASGVFVAFVFDFILRTARSYFVDSAGKNADVVLASKLFEHVMGMRFDARPASAGALAANLREYESLREFFTSATLLSFADLPFALLFILIIAMIAGPVALVPLLAVPILLGVGFALQLALREVMGQTQRETFQKHAILVESIEGLDTIKITGSEGRAQRLWERFIGRTARTAMRARFISTIGVNIATLTQNLVSVLVVVVGVYEIAAGNLTTGGLVAASLLSARAMAPLAQLASLLVRLHSSFMSLRSLDKVMQTPLERPPGKAFLHRPELQGEIEFRDLSFAYPGQSHAALAGVRFRIEPGEKVGIIGRIGSGKSTLARLLSGLYTPSAGAILVDGTDLRQIDPADLRRNIGYVPQDAFLFFGSVRDNIALSAPNVSHSAILRAATIAGVDDFIKRHPEGYDMQVGENGKHLSGGQREAVTIARALLNDPPILVMDEPSGAMDATAEAWLKRRLRDILPGKTLLLVTHRPSMLDLVDRLIVIDDGRIVADGQRERVLQALNQGELRIASRAGAR